MTWEWKIGDPVDDSNGGTMDAMNWGHGGEDDDNYSGSYGCNGGYTSPLSSEEINRRNLELKKDAYKNKMKQARGATNDDNRIRYYCEALKYANEYFEQSERLGIKVDGMPDRNNLFSEEDVDWISQKHYDELYKVHILSADQTENLENLLIESGNGVRIERNIETYRAISEKSDRNWAIYQAQNLNEDYFKHIEKANDLALKEKSRPAIKEYQKAIDAYNEFFQSDYVKEGMKHKMPERSLTSDDVDHIMIIYKKTHPLLTSKKANEKINNEILDMLGGDWDDRLSAADLEVAKILEEKKLEKQKRKEKVEDIGADVIVGVRIVADSIFKRFKR